MMRYTSHDNHNIETTHDKRNKFHHILTIIGHRFGHLSGLDESSARDSSIFLHGIAFRVYLASSKTIENTTYH